uniref:Transposase n=1 Tax=Ascaris lumbricoides TaxID=6252 RepID=A0A0M3HQX9_ASCLU
MAVIFDKSSQTDGTIIGADAFSSTHIPIIVSCLHNTNVKVHMPMLLLNSTS